MVAGETRQHLPHIFDSVEYKDYQLPAIRKLAGLSSFLLADDMGLGKSLQAITIADIDFKRAWAKRMLVVCPAPLKWNWEDELTKFSSFSYRILDGTPSTRKQQLQDFQSGSIEILIVNYEQVVAHVVELNTIGFDIVIYDEAHYIKNHKSKRSIAALKLRANRHFLLTASPMLNQVDELWTLLHRINGERFPRFRPFLSRYAIFGGYKNKQIVGVKNRDELNNIINQVMVRRLAKDVLSLEEPTIVQIPIELTPIQRELYDKAFNELKVESPNGGGPIMEFDNPLVKYLRLKQICGTAASIPEYEDDSAKLDHAVEMITQMVHNEPDSPSEPVVVFTQFRAVLACLVDRLSRTRPQITPFVLHGDVPSNRRLEIIKEWSSFHDSHRQSGVLATMLQIGGTGFNMVAASKCIFLDKLYVPKLNEQAVGRLNRIGQTKPVQVFELIARNTIEQRIESILKRKRKLFKDIVEESDWKRALYEALTQEDDEDGTEG